MRICRNWLKGQCEFGAVCIFAHGECELRAVPGSETNKVPQKPKTAEVCLVSIHSPLLIFDEVSAWHCQVRHVTVIYQG